MLAVLDEVATWQQRPLDPVYPLVFFDAIRVKIRDEGLVQHKAVYLALGVTASGTKDVLGFWIAQTEGASFWQRVMTELQGRGVQDILIAVHLKRHTWDSARPVEPYKGKGVRYAGEKVRRKAGKTGKVGKK